MIQHLPVLGVILPLMGAPICATLPRAKLAAFFATLITWSSLGVSIALLVKVTHHGPIAYALGNWAPPIGIEYRVDLLSAFMLVLVSAMGSIAMPFAWKSVAKEIDKEKQGLFYTVYLLCLAGLLGIIVTNDAFNIFVFLEISSLATYTLIAMSKRRKSLVAAFEYLILGTIGATFYLIGVGLLYMMTGTLNITDLAERLPPVIETAPILMALAFITIGLALKFALFPLHLWLCNAYAYAPSFVSAFLASTATKVSIYVLIRLLFTIFGKDFAFGEMPLSLVFAVLALFAMMVGSLVAIYQDNIKRLLAYSSVAQIGYIILGLSLANEAGMTAAILHLMNHALAKGALFLAVGCVFYRTGAIHTVDFRGLGKQMPWTMAAFVIAGLSLIGVPATAGFISKWYLVAALIDKQLWLAIVVVVISSLLAIIYVWRVVEAAYFKERPSHLSQVKEAPLPLLVSTWVMVFGNIILGLNAAPGIKAALRITHDILGGM